MISFSIAFDFVAKVQKLSLPMRKFNQIFSLLMIKLCRKLSLAMKNPASNNYEAGFFFSNFPNS
jgi:hypothetical protein